MNASKVGADDYIAAGRGPDLEQQPRTRLGHVQPVEATALLARTYTEPPAIIGGGIVPRQGLALVGGPAKRGKSLLLLQQAICRALGWPWLGFPTSPGCTLVFQAEIPEPQLQARLRVQTSTLAAPLPVGAVHFVTHRGLRFDQRDGFRSMRVLIETLRPDLVQIDPLARFMSGDENSTREMGRIVASLDELIQSYGVAIEIVHHTGKPSSDDPRHGGERLRGSSALFAAADSVLMFDQCRDSEDPLFKLGFELRHGAEPGPLLLRRTEQLWYERSGPPADLLQVAAIVERLPLRYQQLLDAVQADLDVKERKAQGLVARAKKAGLILAEEGVYRAAKVPHAVPLREAVAVDGTADYRTDGRAVPQSGDE